MQYRPIRGFPLSDDFATTRVPNAVLGRLLVEVDNTDVVKLILRAVWLLEHQRGYPQYITIEDLKRDRVVCVTHADETDFNRSLNAAIKLRVLIEVTVNGVPCLMLNTESAQRAAFNANDGSISVSTDDDDVSDDWDRPASSSAQSDAFRSYEENIGFLTPMIRESILTALEDFTDEDITYAIRIAVENEARSWSFVAGVLRRWSREGIPNEYRSGSTGRERDDRRISQDELRKYLAQQRKRSRTSRE